MDIENELYEDFLSGNLDAKGRHDAAQGVLKDKAFNGVLELAHEAARRKVKLEKLTGFAPTVTIVFSKGDHATYELESDNFDEQGKYEAMRELGRVVADNHPTPDHSDHAVCVVMTSEAWEAQFKDGEKMTRPSKSANRIEVLITAGMSIDQQRTGMIEDTITRNSKNVMSLKPHRFAPYVFKENAKSAIDSKLLLEFWIGYANRSVPKDIPMAMETINKLCDLAESKFGKPMADKLRIKLTDSLLASKVRHEGGK